MTGTISRIAAHYDRFTGSGRRFIDVPEWGDAGAPLRVYWKPYTLEDRRMVFVDKEDAAWRSFAELVALKAEDEAGKRIFDDIKDAYILAARADTAVVTRIALAMMDGPTLRDMEKNSTASPSSTSGSGSQTASEENSQK